MEPVPPFATVVEADAYNSAYLFGQAWAPLSAAVKGQALYTATQILHNNVKLAVVTDGSLPIPLSLVNATSEYARILATDSATNPAEAGGPTPQKLKVGPIELDFGAASAKEEYALAAPYVVIPAHVLAMISHLIQGIVVPVVSNMMPVRNV